MKLVGTDSQTSSFEGRGAGNRAQQPEPSGAPVVKVRRQAWRAGVRSAGRGELPSRQISPAGCTVHVLIASRNILNPAARHEVLGM